MKNLYFYIKSKSNLVALSFINFILLLLVSIFVLRINSYYEKFILEINKLEELKKELMEYIKTYNLSDNQKISLYIKDLSTDYTIRINSEELIPSASLVKIPIMAAVYYLTEKGKIFLDNELIYQRKHLCGGSGIIKNYKFGKKFKIRELVELMITISDNIATHMLIEYIGIKNLNEIFKELGLKNTNISRYVMDLRARDKGIENYTTAEDIGLLLEKIYKKELVSKNSSNEMLLFLMKQKISDRIPKKLPREVAVAHKTGLMRNVCHDAGIVYTRNGDFIICILTKNLDSNLAKEIIAEVAYKTYSLYDNMFDKFKSSTSNDYATSTNNDFGDDTGDN
ncbi:MAG: serine hydrolase [Endomicrobiia bacterium]